MMNSLILLLINDFLNQSKNNIIINFYSSLILLIHQNVNNFNKKLLKNMNNLPLLFYR
jgi:hypothetical protein